MLDPRFLSMLNQTDPRLALSMMPQAQLARTPTGGPTMRGAPPQMATSSAPPPPAPPGMNRGLLGALMPISDSAQESGLLTRDDTKSLRRSQLLRLGAALMSASAPSHGRRPGTLEAIGNAVSSTMPDWSKIVDSTVQQNATLHQYRQHQQMESRRQAIMEGNPPGAQESRAQAGSRYMKVMDELRQVGDTEGAQQIGMFLAQSGLLKEAQDDWTTPRDGIHPSGDLQSPYAGKSDQFQVNSATGQLRWLNAGVPKDPNVSANRYSRNDALLVGQYDREAKVPLMRFETINGAMAVAPDARNGNASAQFAMMDNFIRTFNPSAVVRSGMIDLFKENLPVSQRARGELNKLLNNKGGISQATIEEMVVALSRVEGHNWTDVTRVRGRFRSRALKDTDTNPDLLFDLPARPDFSGWAIPNIRRAPGSTTGTSINEAADSLLGGGRP